MSVMERNRLIQQYELFLTMILEDRQQVFPLPIRDVGTMMKRLSYVNRRSPRNKSVTGRGILKYFVSLTLRDRNVHSSVIGLTTDSLWKSATSHERAEYVIMSKDLNKRMMRFK
ncbi:hypothetical protein RhiirA5_348544 [Rhizophagus irregularis]|nr:hypothetical protein RhiirA5_348544 [Rhizophagus irregularis]PKK78713.1 hypothetical protein RhiirC2_728982 [Rhizophagus irregularis]PKY38774.1 hypothetical protein RhiirA4_392492 [Rhizophagus irregularis]CAB4387126.1 unnamed protein product [Rhizophagus irregularis]CAB4416377.1 unnamed protein product [Rhizophagus irregularis]